MDLTFSFGFYIEEGTVLTIFAIGGIAFLEWHLLNITTGGLIGAIIGTISLSEQEKRDAVEITKKLVE